MFSFYKLSQIDTLNVLLANLNVKTNTHEIIEATEEADNLLRIHLMNFAAI